MLEKLSPHESIGCLSDFFFESYRSAGWWSFLNGVSCPFSSTSASFGDLSLAIPVVYHCYSCLLVEHYSLSTAFLLTLLTVARSSSFSLRMNRSRVMFSFPDDSSLTVEMRWDSSECYLWAQSSLKQCENESHGYLDDSHQCFRLPPRLRECKTRLTEGFRCTARELSSRSLCCLFSMMCGSTRSSTKLTMTVTSFRFASIYSFDCGFRRRENRLLRSYK